MKSHNYLYVHEKMSNVTQNMDNFWPCVMYVTQDRTFFLPVVCRLVSCFQQPKHDMPSVIISRDILIPNVKNMISRKWLSKFVFLLKLNNFQNTYYFYLSFGVFIVTRVRTGRRKSWMFLNLIFPFEYPRMFLNFIEYSWMFLNTVTVKTKIYPYLFPKSCELI